MQSHFTRAPRLHPQVRSDLARLRLAELQGQLEPHFLFNALNSVSALVRAGNQPHALSALMRMSGMMRHALRVRSARWISVQDELNFVNEYMELQRLRFGDGFKVHWELDPAPWDAYACAPLLFQPLVENAFHHCVEISGRPQMLCISLRVAAHGLKLSIANALVKDSGTARLRSAGHGLGLPATRERLALLYGSAASLSAGAVGQQHVAVLSFPLRDLHEQMESTDC